MNILTKLSVVLLVLVALLACPVFIKQATTIPSYRDKFEKQVLLTKLIDQHRKVTATALEDATDKLTDSLAAYDRLRDARDEEVQELRGRIATLELTESKSSNRADRLQLMLDDLAKSSAEAARRTDVALADNTKLRGDINDLYKEQSALKDRSAQQQAALRRAEELVRVWVRVTK